MKIKNFIASTTFALVASASLATGLSLSREAKVAKAEGTTTIGNSGSVFLQLNTETWKSSDSKIALYMFNNTEEQKAWGDFVTPSGSAHYVEYVYDLDFTPEGCIAFRFDPAVEVAGDWCFEDYSSNPAIWSRTNDIDFDNVIWLGNYYPSSKWTESGSLHLNVNIKGGASDDWTVATVDEPLTNIKVNDGGDLEIYGAVTLPAETYFKTVCNDGWYGKYDAHSSVASNLSGGGEGNIHNTEEATYEFYFSFDGESTYITDPVLAEADEWSQSFLGANCDATKSSWSSAQTAFESLSPEAQALIEGQEHIDHKEEAGNFVAKAVQRYDYVLERYGVYTELKPSGYVDFLGRVNANKVVPGSASAVSSFDSTIGSDNTMIIVITIAAVSALAFTLLLVLKKKKQK